MDPQTRRTLLILEEIAGGRMKNQRALAEKLEISLGLVNTELKRLRSGGLFSIAESETRRPKYKLTQKGVAEKNRLTCVFIGAAYRGYREARDRLTARLAHLAEIGVRAVVCYGAGEVAEAAEEVLSNTEIRLVAVVDDPPGDRSGESPALYGELKTLDFDRILVTTPREGAREALIRAGVGPEQIEYV
jgi:DNA-binding PadR family transcriptional regulator